MAKIRRATDYEMVLFPEAKWMVESKGTWDVCKTLGEAIRYWLWHSGVDPKIAFGWFNKEE